MDIKGLRFLQRSFHTFLHTNQKIMLPEGQRLRPRFWKKKHDEAFCLSVYDSIKEAFGMMLPVGNRKLLVGDISFEIIGEQLNILQVSIEFDWYEKKERVETEPEAKELVVLIEKKGD